MTGVDLLKMARCCAYRFRGSREWADCVQEAALEILARTDRPWRRAGENGARRVVHNERRHHRRREEAVPDRSPARPVRGDIRPDIETMLAVVHERAARMLWRHHAEGVEIEVVSLEEGLAPHSAANLCCRARAKIRAAFPRHHEP